MSQHVESYLLRLGEQVPAFSLAASRWVRFILAVSIACAGLLVDTHPAYADTRLKVTVTDCDQGTPLIGALVQVTYKSGSDTETKKAKTDGSGVATISIPSSVVVMWGVVTGTNVSVQASMRGYETKKTNVRFSSSSTQKVKMCLKALATPTPLPTKTKPPTEPPKPVSPPIVARPTASPTPDPLQPHSRCLAYLCNRLGSAASGWDVERMLARVNTILASCRSTGDCVKDGVVVEAVNTLARELIKLVGYSALDAVYQLLASPGGTGECASLSAYNWELVRQLVISGLNQTATAVYSPAGVLIRDEKGRRSGFLPDGSIVEEIPDSRAILSEGVKYVFVPSAAVSGVGLKGTGQGYVKLDVLNSTGAIVKDLTFDNFYVTEKSNGDLNLAAPAPALELDRDGNGNTQVISPSNYTEWQTQSMFPVTPTLPPSPTAARLPAQTDGDGAGMVVIILALALGGVGLWVMSSRRRLSPRPAVAGTLPGRAGATPSQAGAMSARLIGMSGVGAGRGLVLGVQPTVIGRSSACDLVLPDATASRQHARIVFAQGGWYIQDMGSKAGIRVNGRPVQAVRLNYGDQIQIGSSIFRFQP
ncbi:MAG: FHA domain-containing protein [Chloroflexota bacterium]